MTLLECWYCGEGFDRLVPVGTTWSRPKYRITPTDEDLVPTHERFCVSLPEATESWNGRETAGTTVTNGDVPLHRQCWRAAREQISERGSISRPANQTTLTDYGGESA